MDKQDMDGYEQVREMDLQNSRHVQELRHWCDDHWVRTVKRSIENYTVLLFHDCCYSFSRRAYSKKGSHPPLQSVSVLRIPTLKWVCTAEQFLKWMLDSRRSYTSRAPPCWAACLAEAAPGTPPR